MSFDQYIPCSRSSFRSYPTKKEKAGIKNVKITEWFILGTPWVLQYRGCFFPSCSQVKRLSQFPPKKNTFDFFRNRPITSWGWLVVEFSHVSRRVSTKTSKRWEKPLNSHPLNKKKPATLTLTLGRSGGYDRLPICRFGSRRFWRSTFQRSMDLCNRCWWSWPPGWEGMGVLWMQNKGWD